MKILHVITKLDVGGAQSVVRELVREQCKSGHEVTVATGTLEGSTESIRAAGATVIHIPSLVHRPSLLQDVKALRDVRSALRPLATDLVHTHSIKGGLIGRMAARSLGIPTVHTAHGWMFDDGAKPAHRAFALVGESVAGLLRCETVVLTHADAKLAERFRVGRATRRHVIVNGVSELERVSCSKPRTGPIRLVTVARLVDRQKRVDIVVDAVKMVPNIELAIVGDGPLRAQLETNSADHDDRIHFLGQVDPAAALSWADIFVLLSDYEGLPMTVLEAMTAHLPVIINSLPYASEVVAPGYNGFIVAKEAKALAELLAALPDRSQLELMGENAFATWQSQFTAEKMANEYLKVYQIAMDNQRPGLRGPRRNRPPDRALADGLSTGSIDSADPSVA